MLEFNVWSSLAFHLENYDDFFISVIVSTAPNYSNVDSLNVDEQLKAAKLDTNEAPQLGPESMIHNVHSLRELGKLLLKGINTTGNEVAHRKIFVPAILDFKSRNDEPEITKDQLDTLVIANADDKI